MHASNGCADARIAQGAGRGAPRPLAPPDAGLQQGALRAAVGARPLDAAHQDAPHAARQPRRPVRQGRRRAPRPLASGCQPGRRHAAAARLPHPPRGRAGPAHQARRHHRRGRRRGPPHRRGAPGGPRGLHSLPDARAARPPVGCPPRPPLPEHAVTAPSRLSITDDNRRWWTLGAMCFALFMVMLDNTVVNVALPSIQEDLRTSISGLEWTVNAYTLSFAVLLVTGGRLGDIFGRRRIFLAGVVVFGLSSAFIGFSQSDDWLVAGRALQGVGAALMMPATLSIITNAFPPHERGKAIGTWAGVSAVALAIGPVVGGFLVEHVSWQSIFFLNLPVAAVAVAVTLFATPESRDETATHQVDLAGVATLTLGLAALVLALVEVISLVWDSTVILALLATAATGLAGFVAAEQRSREPMVDFGFF